MAPKSRYCKGSKKRLGWIRNYRFVNRYLDRAQKPKAAFVHAARTSDAAVPVHLNPVSMKRPQGHQSSLGESEYDSRPPRANSQTQWHRGGLPGLHSLAPPMLLGSQN